MKEFSEKNLGYYGAKYELKVINQIIGTNIEKEQGKYRREFAFGRKILPIISPEHFTHDLARRIVVFLKNYYKKTNTIPYYDTIEEVIKSKVVDDMEQEMVLTYLSDVKNVFVENKDFTQETALNFINTKNLYSAWKKIENEYIKRGKYDKFKEAAQIMLDAIVEMTDEERLEAMVAGDNRDLENVRGMLIPTGIKALDIDMNGGLGLGEFAIVVAGLKVGKAQPNTCKVYTPEGYKLMGDIKIGDEVLGSDGKTQQVLGVYPQGVIDYYKVEFSDKTSTYCSADHLWAVESLKQQERNRKTGETKYEVKTLKEIAKNYKRSNGQLNYRIPVTKPLEFNKKKLTIHPYIMGVMLGDGSLSNNFRITTSDSEVIQKFNEILGENYKINHVNRYDYYIKDVKNNHNLLKDNFNSLGLLGKKSDTKFIPKNYLYSSIEDRKELLRGLIDSDGYISKEGKISFSSTSKQLVDDFKQLVLSLGGFCSKISKRRTNYTYKGETNQGKTSYRINVSFTSDIQTISYLDRKQSRYKPRVKKAKSKYISNIELVGQTECTCIKVSNKDSLYVTDDFILTHNTTFATFIANNAALLGYNVLQIFFEDTEEQVKMKHRSKFTGMNLSAVSNKRNKDRVARKSDKVLEQIKQSNGCLVPLKMDSTNTTVKDIEKVILRAREQGVWFQDTQEFKKITFDVVLIDYVDCIKPKGSYKDDWGGDKEIMRDLEKLCSRKHGLGFACWAFTQGGRSSLNSSLVAEGDVGGSIKKLQIAHFIASISKTIEQRPEGKATFAILGSRIGNDGIIYKDCTFDNANMKISLEKVENIADFIKSEEYDEYPQY
jgi:hypothetical protein